MVGLASFSVDISVPWPDRVSTYWPFFTIENSSLRFHQENNLENVLISFFLFIHQIPAIKKKLATGHILFWRFLKRKLLTIRRFRLPHFKNTHYLNKKLWYTFSFILIKLTFLRLSPGYPPKLAINCAIYLQSLLSRVPVSYLQGKKDKNFVATGCCSPLPWARPCWRSRWCRHTWSP